MKRITINISPDTYLKLKQASENLECSMSSLLALVLDVTVDDILLYSLKIKECEKQKTLADEHFKQELKTKDWKK